MIQLNSMCFFNSRLVNFALCIQLKHDEYIPPLASSREQTESGSSIFYLRVTI